MFTDPERPERTGVAVDGVSLEIREGELVTLLGPSGCGKTTALRVIAGFETPTCGRVLIGGQDVSLSGKVSGSVFGGAASGLLADSARVGRNLYFGGYSLETKPASVVTRDLLPYSKTSAPPGGVAPAAGHRRPAPDKNKASPLHLAGEASPLAAPFRAAVAKSP